MIRHLPILVFALLAFIGGDIFVNLLGLWAWIWFLLCGVFGYLSVGWGDKLAAWLVKYRAQRAMKRIKAMVDVVHQAVNDETKGDS